MNPAGNSEERQLTALLIAPDQELARQFRETLPAIPGLEILNELKAYPPRQTLEIRLKQVQPDVVLLDLATDFQQAAEVIRSVIALNPSIHVVGLHNRSESEAILDALREGVSAFLCAPFDVAVGLQALGRIRRLIEPRYGLPQSTGRVMVLTSVKPGSGASTLTAQAGLLLSRKTRKRVLLVDLDPMNATLSYFLKLPESNAGDLWSRITRTDAGIDAVPAAPADAATPSAAVLHEFLERARARYDWVILDLPAVFHRASLLALPECERTFLVTTAELPSLHLARKAVNFLSQLGFGRDRVSVLVNRIERRSGLAQSDVEKILNIPVRCLFPNDYFALDRALTAGEIVAATSELGREMESFAEILAGADSGGPGAAAGHAAAGNSELKVQNLC